jgi:type I restriction enzyme S subunit
MLDKGPSADEWEELRLDNFFKLTSGATKPDDLVPEPNELRPFPVYGGNGVMGYSSAFNAEGENIVIGRVGANCGCVHHVIGRCWITDNALFTSQKKRTFNTIYMAYLLEQLNLAKLRGQSGQPLVSQGPIYSLKALVAPLPEQHKIAEILQTWDGGIEQLKELRTLKNQRLAALRAELLFAKLRTDGRRRNWQPRRLAEVTRELTNRNGEKALGRDVVKGVTNTKGIVPMRDQTIADDISRYKRLPPCAFAYNPMRINVGSIAMNDGEEEVLVSPDYVVFACSSDGLDPKYFEHLCKTQWWNHYINSGGSGSVRMRTYYADLAALKLPLPDIEEQRAIASILNAARYDLQLTERKIAAVTRQKRGLMQKLLTGEWRVVTDSCREAAE